MLNKKKETGSVEVFYPKRRAERPAATASSVPSCTLSLWGDCFLWGGDTLTTDQLCSQRQDQTVAFVSLHSAAAGPASALLLFVWLKHVMSLPVSKNTSCTCLNSCWLMFTELQVSSVSLQLNSVTADQLVQAPPPRWQLLCRHSRQEVCLLLNREKLKQGVTIISFLCNQMFYWHLSDALTTKIQL